MYIPIITPPKILKQLRHNITTTKTITQFQNHIPITISRRASNLYLVWVFSSLTWAIGYLSVDKLSACLKIFLEVVWIFNLSGIFSKRGVIDRIKCFFDIFFEEYSQKSNFRSNRSGIFAIQTGSLQPVQTSSSKSQTSCPDRLCSLLGA